MTETAARAWTLPLIDKGVNSKNNGCSFYSSYYEAFTYFPFLFCLNKDANYLLPADIPGRRLPAHGAAANAPLDPMTTRALHWDM